MDIIKFIGKEKNYLEIYKMYLNEARAKSFWKEESKNIEFFRLQFLLFADYLNLQKYIHDGETIYMFEKLPISEEKIDVKRSYNFSSGYTLSICRGQECFISKTTKEFREHFIENYFSSYQYEALKTSIALPVGHYIFLNPIIGCIYSISLQYSDNVASLPTSIVTEYFMEKAMLEEASIAFGFIDDYTIKKIMNCFDFECSTNLTEKQFNDLLDAKIIDKQSLQRILCGQSISKHI